MKQRTVVIGDIHGHESWKKIISKEKDCRFIFLGDYVDSFSIPDITIKENLLEILQFKKENPDNVILLLGNHDYHYLNTKSKYSGFRYSLAKELHEIFYNAYYNEKIFNIIFEEDNCIFSHAGITKYWLENVSNVHELSEINDLEKFDFDTLDWNSYMGMSWTGDSISNSPIWVRPSSLDKDKLDGYIQVVGHTISKKLLNINNKIYICDCMHMGEYLEITKDNTFNTKNFKENE